MIEKNGVDGPLDLTPLLNREAEREKWLSHSLDSTPLHSREGETPAHFDSTPLLSGRESVTA